MLTKLCGKNWDTLCATVNIRGAYRCIALNVQSEQVRAVFVIVCLLRFIADLTHL